MELIFLLGRIIAILGVITYLIILLSPYGKREREKDKKREEIINKYQRENGKELDKDIFDELKKIYGKNLYKARKVEVEGYYREVEVNHSTAHGIVTNFEEYIGDFKLEKPQGVELATGKRYKVFGVYKRKKLYLYKIDNMKITSYKLVVENKNSVYKSNYLREMTRFEKSFYIFTTNQLSKFILYILLIPLLILTINIRGGNLLILFLIFILYIYILKGKKIGVYRIKGTLEKTYTNTYIVNGDTIEPANRKVFDINYTKGDIVDLIGYNTISEKDFKWAGVSLIGKYFSIDAYKGYDKEKIWKKKLIGKIIFSIILIFYFSYNLKIFHNDYNTKQFWHYKNIIEKGRPIDHYERVVGEYALIPFGNNLLLVEGTSAKEIDKNFEEEVDKFLYNKYFQYDFYSIENFKGKSPFDEEIKKIENKYPLVIIKEEEYLGKSSHITKNKILEIKRKDEVKKLIFSYLSHIQKEIEVFWFNKANLIEEKKIVRGLDADKFYLNKNQFLMNFYGEEFDKKIFDFYYLNIDGYLEKDRYIRGAIDTYRYRSIEGVEEIIGRKNEIYLIYFLLFLFVQTNVCFTFKNIYYILKLRKEKL